MDVDAEVGVLHEGVTQLKAMSRAIGAEAKEQGKLMDSLEASMEQAK